MSLDFAVQIEELLNDIYFGRFNEFDKKTKALLKTNLSLEQALHIKAIEGIIVSFKGQHKKALKIGQEVLKESEAYDNIYLKLDAYITTTSALFNEARLNEGKEDIEKALQLVQDESKLDPQKIAFRKALLLMNRTFINFDLGDAKQAFESITKSFEYAKKSGNKCIESFVMSYLGMSYLFIGNLEMAIKYVNEALESAYALGSKIVMMNNHYPHGIILLAIKQYNEAIKSYKTGIKLALETGATALLKGFYNTLGITYMKLLQFDKALENFELAIEKTTRGKYMVLGNINGIYLALNKIEKAEETLLLAREDSIKAGEIRVRPGITYNLILTSLLLGKPEKAKEYLQELEELISQSDIKGSKFYLFFARVLILKESTRIKDWLQAIDILEELLEDKELETESQIDALYHLVELQLKELQVSADEEILKGVKTNIEKLQKSAEEMYQPSLLANIYRLKSQLALIELDAKSAINLLVTAKTIATEKKLELIAAEIEKDHNKLLEQQNMWNELKDQNAPLKATLKQVSINDSAKRIANETVLEVHDKTTGEVVEYRKLFALKI